MREERVAITTQDGVADAKLYAPSGQEPRSAVLYYSDGIGIRPAFFQMAQRLAREGYFVLLPNIYYRTTSGPAFALPFDFQNAQTRARFHELSAPLTPQAMERDALAYLEFLQQHCRPRPLMGVVGYCLTGRMAMHTAAAAPDRIAAAASFHGGGLFADSADSPHHLLPRIRARLYFGHASRDNSMPADAICRFELALEAWGGSFESEIYPAAHGWTVPGREVYDAVQAERHHSKLNSFFAEALQ